MGGAESGRAGNGAFTGEVSASMLADLHCTWVLVGHSERRQLFGETDAMVTAKVGQALGQSIRPVICLGETLQERESDITEQVLARQLDAVVPVLADRDPSDYVLAYEPVWAIGTGLTAIPGAGAGGACLPAQPSGRCRRGGCGQGENPVRRVGEGCQRH